MPRPLVVFAVLALSCLAATCLAQSDEPDTLTGPVTAIASSSAFDVSGRHVSLSSDAQLCTLSTGALALSSCKLRSAFAADLYIGERVELSGSDVPVNHSFIAHKVTIQRVPHNISGTAIIDLIPSTQPANSAERTLRADGYLLHITPDTKLKFEPPLTSLAGVSTNQWIQYSGELQNDGAVLLKSAGIKTNTISHAESQLLDKGNYDPSTTPQDAHQNSVQQAFLGVDPKKLPPYHDDAMQARIERIGTSLIPAYQRALPDSDFTKIHFRFQLVDKKQLHDAFTTPAGVILVPYQVVQRLQNDDQLATILADNIAEALEKDSYRIRPLSTASKIGTVAQYATITLPVVGIATSAGALGVNSKEQQALDAQLAQSGRVSLWLLHDAGYNIQQAPLAWWLLASKKEKPLDQVNLPPRAESLYNSLGLLWRNPVMNSAPSMPSAASSANATSTPNQQN